jgi:hypothetical protein
LPRPSEPPTRTWHYIQALGRRPQRRVPRCPTPCPRPAVDGLNHPPPANQPRKSPSASPRLTEGLRSAGLLTGQSANQAAPRPDSTFRELARLGGQSLPKFQAAVPGQFGYQTARSSGRPPHSPQTIARCPNRRPRTLASPTVVPSTRGSAPRATALWGARHPKHLVRPARPPRHHRAPRGCPVRPGRAAERPHGMIQGCSLMFRRNTAWRMTSRSAQHLW